MKPQTKKCSRCEKTKALTDFYAMKSAKTGRRPECKSCTRAHPEKQREACRRWRSRNKEKAAACSRKWYRENPEKAKGYRKRWGELNPEKSRFNSLCASAKRKHLFDISFETWLDRFWNMPCTYCGEESRGGMDRVNNELGYTNDNCVPCCFLCNSIKRNLDLDSLIRHLEKMIYGVKTLRDATT